MDRGVATPGRTNRRLAIVASAALALWLAWLGGSLAGDSRSDSDGRSYWLTTGGRDVVLVSKPLTDEGALGSIPADLPVAPHGAQASLTSAAARQGGDSSPRCVRSEPLLPRAPPAVVR